MPDRRQMAMQRASSLVPLRALLAEFGVAIETVLDGTGVAPGQLRPDAFIAYADYLAILDNACDAIRRDDVGLMLGQRQTLEALGPLGKVLRHAATLGEAIAEFAELQIHNSTGGAVYLMRADRDVILGYGVYDPPKRISHQIHDLVLAVGCNLVAELTSGAVRPEEIHFARSAPEDASRYQRLGPFPNRFGQIQTGIVLKVSDFGFGLPEADRDLHDAALSALDLPPGSGAGTVAGRVRHILRPLLLTGQGGMEPVANRLDLHPRTLRRKLRDEGTSFEAIKDEVRDAAARELLQLGDLGVADIAATLDYASASSFVHAFGRWNGIPPGKWRASDRTRRNLSH